MLVPWNCWSSQPVGDSPGRGCITWKPGFLGRKGGVGGKNCHSANFKAFLPCWAYAEGEKQYRISTPVMSGSRLQPALVNSCPNLVRAANRVLGIGSRYWPPAAHRHAGAVPGTSLQTRWSYSVLCANRERSRTGRPLHLIAAHYLFLWYAIRWQLTW